MRVPRPTRSASDTCVDTERALCVGCVKGWGLSHIMSEWGVAHAPSESRKSHLYPQGAQKGGLLPKRLALSVFLHRFLPLDPSWFLQDPTWTCPRCLPVTRGHLMGPLCRPTFLTLWTHPEPEPGNNSLPPLLKRLGVLAGFMELCMPVEPDADLRTEVSRDKGSLRCFSA